MFVFGQDLPLCIMEEFELYTHFCLKGPKHLFELAKVGIDELRIIRGILFGSANAHGIKNFQISESSNYRVFEFQLMGVNCVRLGLNCSALLAQHYCLHPRDC